MMMHFQRLVNSFVPRSVLRMHPRTITIVVLGVVTILYFFCFPSIPRFNSFECPSDVNSRNAALKAKGINVLSSDDYRKNVVAQGKHAAANIKTFNYNNHDQLLYRSECVDFKSVNLEQKLKICIYDPTKDLYLSYHLKTFGSWEKENVAEMLKALEMFPNMKLVDLGSSLGTFTLQAAARGTEVIAVDALLSNHQLLQQSLMKNSLSCRVTLLHNAVYGRRAEMKITVNPANVGGSVVSEILDFNHDKVVKSQRVDSICLDDLVPLVRGQDIFLKIDLEGSEEAVLKCAEIFFRETNVKVVLLEWMNYRQDGKASRNIKGFLTSQQMVPTWGVDRERIIDLDASHGWPDNVFWMKE